MWESSHYLSPSQNRSKRNRVLGGFYCNKFCIISHKYLITPIFELMGSNQRMCHHGSPHYPEYSQKNSNQHSLYHNYNILSCWIAAIVAIGLIKSFVSLPSTYVRSSAGPRGTAGPSQSHIHPSSSGTQLSDWSRSGNSFLSDPPQLPGGGWRGRGRASQPSQAKPSHVCIPPSCHNSIHPHRYEPTVRTYACLQSHRGVLE